MAVENPGEYWRLPSHAEIYESERFRGTKGQLYRSLEEGLIRNLARSISPGSSVLDAPVGTGRITLLLLNEGFRVVGSDISIPMMSIARQTVLKSGCTASFFQSEVSQLACSDGSFDAVACIGLLMHLNEETRKMALRELVRVSRRFLLLQYGCIGAFLRLKALLTGTRSGDVLHAVSKADIQRDLNDAGLKEIARKWVLRPFSSSVVLLVVKDGALSG